MADFKADDMQYLLQGDKFWELINVGKVNHVRYGKLVNGSETHINSGTSEFASQDDAVLRAKSLVKAKTDRGYASIAEVEKATPTKAAAARRGAAPKRQAKTGTYLERVGGGRTEYVRIEVKGKDKTGFDLEVEKGVNGQPQSTSGTHFVVQGEAEAEAKSLTRSFIAKGYRRASISPKSDTDVEVVTNVADLPRKRPRSAEAPESLQVMLDSIGLSRYVLNFETNRVGAMQITVEDFLRLTEQDLTNYNLPTAARKKILASIKHGTWTPYMAQDSDSEVEVIGDQLQSSFIVEKGKGRPPKDISVMLAQTWDDRDPSGWWMSEKLDGVRCYWNGKTLKSRNGNEYMAPDFFTMGFPTTVSLDGELWTGRKKFSECVSIVRRSDSKHDFNEWKRVIYVLFDAPSLGGRFETRLKYLKGLTKTLNSPYLRAHEHVQCQGREHMEQELKRVEELGGEGLMLREPGSNYDNFRSYSLLKVKTFFDAEAVVIGHEEGKGRNEGVMGALRVRGDNGVEFKVGSGFTDAERKRPPKVGTKITYKYQELTKDGKPRFPTYLRDHPGL
jgi:predicted DNA-binding WGR domain protein